MSINNNKYKIRNSRKSLIYIFVVCLIATTVIGIMAYKENEVYRNEEEFRKFADNQYKSAQVFDAINVGRIDYQYGDTVSYAVDYPVCEDERINTFLANKIGEIKGAAVDDYEDEQTKALIISTVVKTTDNGVISLAIHEKTCRESEGQMVTDSSDIHTYHFSKKFADLLLPQQVFTEDYESYCAEFFIDYFTKNYKKEDMVTGWEEYLQTSNEAFDEYVISDTGVTFFFKPGQVLNESFGVVYAGMPIQQAEVFVRDKILKRYIDPTKPMVAITYDDGPGFEAEDRILDCLESNNVVATFFYLGNRIKGNEYKLAKAAKIGCEIGNHSWNHPVLTSLDTEDLEMQFERTNEAIYNACGKYPTVFRPCYGISSDKINKMSGMPVIYWTVDTVDWESLDGEAVYNIVKKQKSLDGKIILMHSIHDSTADATELIIPYLKEKGYQFVTVSELIKCKTGNDPIDGKTYR